jgi:hypothetical protein
MVRWLAVLALAFSCSAGAVETTYTFSGSMTIQKFSADCAGCFTQFEEEHWFPSLHSGQTYHMRGRIEYQPDLILADPHHEDSTPQVFVDVGQYEWAISTSLGFAAGDNGQYGDSVIWADTLPVITRGRLPPDFFFGEDGTAQLFDPTGKALSSSTVPDTLKGFSVGDVYILSSGLARDADGTSHYSHMTWSGTIDQIQPIASPAPEPEAIAMWLVGLTLVVGAARGKRKLRT